MLYRASWAISNWTWQGGGGGKLEGGSVRVQEVRFCVFNLYFRMIYPPNHLVQAATKLFPSF